MKAAASSFVQVAALANIGLTDSDIEIEFLPAPHRQPARLPVGKVAVYAFYDGDDWLKIGKVEPNSSARYTSQHYNAGSAMSTLAGSLSRCTKMKTVVAFEASKPGDWIMTYCSRANILLSAEQPKEVLSLLEAFLHARFRPRYER